MLYGEIITGVFLFSSFLPCILAWNMPQGKGFPVHFDLWGEVDKWGDKTDLFSLPLLAVIIWGAFSTAQYMERRKKNMTYSVMLRILKALVMILLAYINIMSYVIAAGGAERLNAVFVWAVVAAMIGVSLYYSVLVKIQKKRI